LTGVILIIFFGVKGNFFYFFVLDSQI